MDSRLHHLKYIITSLAHFLVNTANEVWSRFFFSLFLSAAFLPIIAKHSRSQQYIAGSRLLWLGPLKSNQGQSDLEIFRA